MSILIIIGGIGFPVVLNLYEFIKAKIRNFHEKADQKAPLCACFWTD